MNFTTSNKILCQPRWLVYAVALFAFTCSANAEHTQFIDANLAGQADKWDKTPQNGIPCMQTYAPYAFLSFDVTVPDPGAVYKLSLSLVTVSYTHLTLPTKA